MSLSLSMMGDPLDVVKYDDDDDDDDDDDGHDDVKGHAMLHAKNKD